MSLLLPSEQVWQALEKELFAVLGMTTAKHEARTVGIVYVVHNRKLYITSLKSTWKVKHIVQNPHVSLTVPIAKRIPFMPWVKIPAATITFSGTAQIRALSDIAPELAAKLFRGQEQKPEMQAQACVIEVTPEKDFVTYGIGVSLMTMREPEKSRGRAPVFG